MKTTYRRLLADTEEQLEQAGVSDAACDAWQLFSACFSVDRSRYFLDRDCEMELLPDQESRFFSLLEKRKKRIPLQYLLGSQEFMGLSFLVSESVLIPRADTETLVEAVLSDCPKEKRAKLCVIDVCTGSGCIAVSLAHFGGFCRVDASDLSKDALAVAEINVKENHVPVRLIRSDLLSGIAGSYDILVSNPPYIADQVIEELEPEVRDHEPRLALSGGEDGLACYRRLINEAPGKLNADGRIYLEIGYDQAEAVAGLLMANGFEEIHVRKDLAGNNRVVSAVWKG